MNVWEGAATKVGRFATGLEQLFHYASGKVSASQPWWQSTFNEYVDLNLMANEALLLHGTTEANAQHIMREGFDDRMCSRGLYGRGVYFACNSCKASQYCGSNSLRCVILARVILGHPHWAEGPMRTHERPPMSTAKVCHTIPPLRGLEYLMAARRVQVKVKLVAIRRIGNSVYRVATCRRIPNC